MGPKTQPHVQSSWVLDQTTARIRCSSYNHYDNAVIITSSFIFVK